MRKFTFKFFIVGLLLTICCSNIYAQQKPETVAVTGRLIRVTPKLSEIDRTSMYGKPLVKTRDMDGIIWLKPFREKMKEVEEKMENDAKDKINKEYLEVTKGKKTDPIQKNTNENLLIPTTTLGANFNGQTSPSLQPTDNNMAAGPNHVVQVVNNTAGTQLTIWNKAGVVLQPATIFATISGVPGDGDPIVLYDQLADRWFIAEFGGSTGTNSLIIAVSTTSNPTGMWSIYQYTDAAFFPDYPKFSIWHNAYYAYTNDFTPPGANPFLGTSVWAFDRAAMIAGSPTAQMLRQRINPGGPFGPLGFMGTVGLEGMTTSTQNGLFVVPTSATQLGIFEVTPNFGASTITVGPTTALPVNAWSTSGAIPQQTGPALGSLSPRLMFKVNYRNNGGTESIVLAHTIGNGALAQVRWYELRRVAGTWTVFQQGDVPGTDGNSRWMPGISMDGCGNIALMYDVAGAGTPAAHPSIRYTGRNPADPLNTMTLPEAVIFNGTVGTGGITRWGDYNTTVQDYTAAGIPTNGSFWSTSQHSNQLTRIANFTLTGGCVAAPNITTGNATITSESCLPNNSVIDPGETVSVSFCVLNPGTANTTNLVGTLQATGGVTSPSGPQNYGVVTFGGPAVCRTFSFVANGTCGSTVTASIQMQDGATNFGTLTYTFQLGVTTNNTLTFSNPSAITIPASGTGVSTGAPATPYPSNITVAGITDPVSKVTVTLTGLNHTFPDDVDMLLVSPTGQKFIILSEVGGANDWVNATITLDDAAAANLSDGGDNPTGTYKPTNFGTGDMFPPPAPAAPYQNPATAGSATFASVFNGLDPNGTWGLYIVDDLGGDIGSITGGWSLQITTSVSACCTGISNDLCSAAQTINCGQTISGTTVGATIDAVSNCNGFPLNTAPGVWYKFTGDGTTVTLSLCGAGTTYDSKIGVFSGTCGALTCVTADDDFCSFIGPSQVTFLSVPATDYYVLVTGFGTAAAGAFSLTRTCVGACTLICPANITVSNDPNQCGALVNYPVLIGIGTCGTITASPASGSFFAVGTTTVNATSTAGPTCSFTVTVNDTQAPVITCPANVTVSCAAAVPAVNLAAATATDNCPGVVKTHVGDVISAQTCANRFVITRTYRATDASGNVTNCTQTITVNDITNPTITTC
ncbi:MAG: hypothetical protein SGI83_08200, partial [Bacteroidota bacterium]|nr:hypothetical protein [Bacteroidota bacterium]